MLLSLDDSTCASTKYHQPSQLSSASERRGVIYSEYCVACFILQKCCRILCSRIFDFFFSYSVSYISSPRRKLLGMRFHSPIACPVLMYSEIFIRVREVPYILRRPCKTHVVYTIAHHIVVRSSTDRFDSRGVSEGSRTWRMLMLFHEAACVRAHLTPITADLTGCFSLQNVPLRVKTCYFK